MNETLQRLGDAIQTNVPTLLAAVAVFVGGWLIALIAARLVRSLLARTTIDNRIGAWISEEGREPNTEGIGARIVFWMLMIFVVIGVLQILGLSMVAGPLSSFQEQVFNFLPRLVSGGALLGLAWIVATGVRFAVRRTLQAVDFDRRVSEQATGPDDRLDEAGAEGAATVPSTTLSGTLAETAYWLVFLLFLPAVLDALGLQGLLAPVNGLVGEFLGFLPNLFAAGLILAVGWMGARIVRRIVTNLLVAAGADRVSERAGMDRVLGRRRASEVLGIAVYALILVPIIVAALNALEVEAVTGPASEMLNVLLAALPRIFAAALLIVLAAVVARLLSGVVAQLLSAMGFDGMLERLGFTARTPGGRTPSQVAGTVVMVAILLFASIEALELLAFTVLAGMVADLTRFLGEVALAMAVLAIGLYLADLAARTIRSSSVVHADRLAVVARVAILVLVGAMTLRQLNVAEDIINLAFGLTLGAVAVASAIAFGIGGRDLAKRYLERLDGGTNQGGPPPASGRASPAPRGL